MVKKNLLLGAIAKFAKSNY